MRREDTGAANRWEAERQRGVDSGVKESDGGILEVWNALSHARNPSNEVAMGDHDTLGDASGAAGVHDDGDV